MYERAEALLGFLFPVALKLGVADHSYVVGGAVRNHVLGVEIKDLDLVVDSLELGASRDSAWFARQLQKAIPVRTNLTTNQYGVAMLTISDSWVLDGHQLKGEQLQIANARRESYGGDGGKGYKPHHTEPASLMEDLRRREFTANTLLWRLADLRNGVANAPVLDLLESGLRDLQNRRLRTPLDPERTFSDDPTRMLRAIKFGVRYGLELDEEAVNAIRKNAPKLALMPWDAVRKILVEDLLQGPDPQLCVQWIQGLEINDVIVDLMKTNPGFQRAVSRALVEMDIRLALLAIACRWPLSPSPVSFYSIEQILFLKMTLDLPDTRDPRRVWDPDQLWAQIKHPPIDQQKLFDRHKLEGAARQWVVMKARELLLLHPELSVDPAKLEARVSDELSAYS